MDTAEYYNNIQEQDYLLAQSDQFRSCFKSMTFTWYTVFKIFAQSSKKSELPTSLFASKTARKSSAFDGMLDRLKRYSTDVEMMAKSIFDTLSLEIEDECAYHTNQLAFIDDTILDRTETMRRDKHPYKKATNDFMRQLNSITSILETFQDTDMRAERSMVHSKEKVAAKLGVKTECHLNGKVKYRGNMKFGNIYDGQGFLNHYNGNLKYRGTFIDGLIHDEECQLFHFNSNVKYLGPILKGKFEGEGKLYHDNGCLKYKGDFVDDKPSGKTCMLFHSNGNLEFNGKIENGYYQGKGALYHSNANLEFEGNFVDGGADGQECIIYHINGRTKYIGTMAKGKMHGYGILKNRRGYNEYEGWFNDGVAVDVDQKQVKALERDESNALASPDGSKKLGTEVYASRQKSQKNIKRSCNEPPAQIDKDDLCEHVRENHFAYRFDCVGEDYYPDDQTYYDHVLNNNAHRSLRKVAREKVESEMKIYASKSNFELKFEIEEECEIIEDKKSQDDKQSLEDQEPKMKKPSSSKPKKKAAVKGKKNTKKTKL